MDDQAAVSPRAGFWRRAVALAVDSLIILLPAQLLVALLFFWTNGEIQGNFGIEAQNCVATTFPVGLQTVISNPTGVVDCRKSLFGLDTSRVLIVSRVTPGDIVTKGVSETFWLDADGQLTDRPGHDVGWAALMLLFCYLLFFEVRTGAGLGKRLMSIRVADARTPDRPGVPIAKAFGRYLLIFAAVIPSLRVQVFFLLRNKDLDSLDRLVGSPIYLASSYGAGFLGLLWLLWMVVAVCRKRDPVNDVLAGTVVIRAR
jgi:uncharacterized RDD family membrane protein YckC